MRLVFQIGCAALALGLLPLQARAQQLVPTSNGFTFGSTTGSTSFYRQESRSEATVLQQVLTLNAAPQGPGAEGYVIINPRETFSVVDERQSQSAGDSQVTVGGSMLSGTNFSVFSN
ncbi:MAG: hypothetical protein VKM92_03915 [Cyanobacteriota bacterium]|jgi:hypothetical protein|nr:hypothetical protein [Cyanobacteriota bacterium]